MDSQPNARINSEQYAAAYIYTLLYKYTFLTCAAYQDVQTNQHTQGTL